MAANPVGRFCACLCGASIDHLPGNCVRMPQCQRTYNRQSNMLGKRALRANGRPRGRECECGCGSSIDHMSINAKYLPECKALARKLFRSTRDRPENDTERKTPKPISSTQRVHTSKCCRECCGLPHRRPHMWRCKVCLQPWEPELRPEQSLLCSSGGTAASHGRLYGAEKVSRGESYNKKGGE